ncbi:MAG: MFS transporter [Gaiellaceae bacterium]
MAGYVFVLTANMNLFAFFALAPTFRDDLGISKFDTSLLLTGAGAMMLILAVPLGFLADRLGRHRVAVAAGVLIVASSIGHAVAPDFWTLMAARIVFGIGFTGMLTAGIAWTASSVPLAQRARAIGGVMPAAASAGLAGPLLGGQLTDLGGTELAYAVLGTLSALSLIWLARSPAGDSAPHAQPSQRELGRILRSPVMLTALTLLLLGVLVDVMVSLLVPLRLDENGLSAGTIGIVLAAGGVLYVLSALVAVRNAERIVNLRAAGIVSFAIALPLIPLALSSSTAMQSAGAISRGLALGVCFTVAFPLGALGATAMGAGLGAANGALMVSSGLANAVGPIGSERVADAVGDTWTFGGLAIACAVAGALMLIAARTDSSRASRTTTRPALR